LAEIRASAGSWSLCCTEAGSIPPLCPRKGILHGKYMSMRCADRGRGWPAAAPYPPGDLVLLANSGFVLEPDFYVAGLHPLGARDLLRARAEVFLKASMAPSAWA
jgi:hypothetical protein